MLLYLKQLGVYLYPTVSNNIAVQKEANQNYGLLQSLIQENIYFLIAEVTQENSNLNRIHYLILISRRIAKNGKPAIKSVF